MFARHLLGHRRVAALAVALVSGLGQGIASAQEAHPLSDAWKGDQLDPKWHVTVLGDAQANESSVKGENGALHLRAGGTNLWDDIDDGLFLWQPANGDCQITLEMRGITRIADASKVGIMVRSSLHSSSPNVYLQGMPKGGNMQVRSEYGASTGPLSGCPGAECNPWGDPETSTLGSMPTILQRLTRTGNVFKAERSYDGGKTWGGLHKGSLAAQDTAMVNLPDDVLVGIAVSATNAESLSGDLVCEAVVGPFTFTQTATRATNNGLVAATATDSNGKSVADVGLILKQGSEVIGKSAADVISNTTSFFLKPGAYTIETEETPLYQAGTPVPFVIQTGKIEELKVLVGKAK